MMLAAEGVAASSQRSSAPEHAGGCLCLGLAFVTWSWLCQGSHLLVLLSGIGGFQCWSHHMPIQLPSPLSRWVKPLACHVTSTVLTVTSGRRSIFGLASWHHPHPSMTQNVAQPAVSCCSPGVDRIRWWREEWPSDILAASGTTPDTASPALGWSTPLPGLGSVDGLWQLCPWHTWESTFPVTCQN